MAYWPPPPWGGFRPAAAAAAAYPGSAHGAHGALLQAPPSPWAAAPHPLAPPTPWAMGAPLTTPNHMVVPTTPSPTQQQQQLAVAAPHRYHVEDKPRTSPRRSRRSERARSMSLRGRASTRRSADVKDVRRQRDDADHVNAPVQRVTRGRSLGHFDRVTVTTTGTPTRRPFPAPRRAWDPYVGPEGVTLPGVAVHARGKRSDSDSESSRRGSRSEKLILSHSKPQAERSALENFARAATTGSRVCRPSHRARDSRRGPYAARCSPLTVPCVQYDLVGAKCFENSLRACGVGRRQCHARGAYNRAGDAGNFGPWC